MMSVALYLADTLESSFMSLAKAFVAVILLGLTGVPRLSSQVLAIADVTVINPRRGSVEPHRTVVVGDGRIREVQPASKGVPRTARVIDGRGKFLIPGLWDAHVHLTKAGVLSLPLFVANGVTGVRDMGSDLREVSAWRSEIERGKLIGPRVKTSGQMLESRATIERMKREGTVEPVDRIRIGVSSPPEARAAVERLAATGVDHIKMRTTPNLETFRAVAQEAKSHNLPFAAHPLDFGGSLQMQQPPRELFRAGLRSVEHLLSFPPLDALTPVERRALFQEMARSGVFLSNTMANLDSLIALPYAEAKKRVEDAAGQLDARRRYVCGYLVADWREQVEEGKDAPYESLRKQLPHVYRDFREMRENGVEFLAGTDVGVIFMYPGFSLHDELEKLVRELAFRPMEVLRIATYNPAVFYGAEREFGSIESGQVADLVLLDANPVPDIRNTRRIQGVMTRGRWLDRAALDRLLREVQEAAASGCGPTKISPH